MIIDACRPYDRLKTFPSIVNTSADDAQRLRQKWPGMFAPDGKISPKPAHLLAPDLEPEPVGAA